METAARVKWWGASHMQTVLRVERKESLPNGARLSCAAHSNAASRRASEWQAKDRSWLPVKIFIGQRRQSLIRRPGTQVPGGRALKAASNPGANNAEAQGTPQAAGVSDAATSPAMPSFSGSVRRASNAADGRNCWSVPDPAGFKLRSKSYPVNKGMEPAKEPLFTLVAVDWFKSDVRIDRLARRPGGLVNRTLKGGPPFVFVVNMQVPAGPVHYSMVYYFASHRPVTEHKLFHAFMHGDEAYRDARLTLLPNIPNGSWLIRQSVGSRPVALAEVVNCRYDKGDHFFEIDVDMGTSALVRSVLSLVLPAVSVLVVDLAFLIRGETEEELPEQLLGAVRLHTLELTSAVPPPPEA